MVLDVVVTGKSGAPISGLQPKDFTVLDDKYPSPISSFEGVDGGNSYVQLIIVVDTLNAGNEQVGYERDQVVQFLRANGGKLAFPTSLEILTDQGMQSEGEFSIDGNALGAALEQATDKLRAIGRSAHIDADEQDQISLQALNDLADREAFYPRRKIMAWISPGWPLPSGPNAGLDENQRAQTFSKIVSISNQLRADHVTLYSINPLGAPGAAGGATFSWRGFVTGISRPDQAQAEDLALEVLATQSGGVALNSGSDANNTSNNSVADLLRKCLSDADAYYELSFEPAPDIKANIFHSVEVRVDKPGFTVRARQGYYSQR